MENNDVTGSDSPLESPSETIQEVVFEKGTALASLLKEENVKEISVFNEKDHVIIPIHCVKPQDKDSDSCKLMIEQMKTKGWCIVDLGIRSNTPPVHSGERFSMFMFPSPFEWKHNPKPAFDETLKEWTASFSNEEIRVISDFFELSEKEKSKFSFADLYGYSSIDHKQSIHMLTQMKYSDEVHSKPKKKWYQFEFMKKLVEKTSGPSVFPIDREFITDRSIFMHELVFDLIDVIALEFNLQKPEISYQADLPFAYEYNQNHTMLDIVRYHNTQSSNSNKSVGETTDDVNCVPHYDPGLFSLSVLSTNEGLQLYDPTNATWYAGPVNTVKGQERLGVLWLGEAAEKVTKGVWKAGVHRVVYPRTESQQPRLTMWYEACTVEQINQSLSSGKNNSITLENVPPSKADIEVNSKTKKQVAQSIERKFGFTYSKTITREETYGARWIEHLHKIIPKLERPKYSVNK